MLRDLLTALEGSALAVSLRNSVLAYPLVNAGHIVGVALLVGGSIPLGLHFLGLGKSVPTDGLRRILGRTIDVGFAIAVCCGFLLFSARALSYADSAFFIAKMATLCAALILSIVLRVLSKGDGKGGVESSVPFRIVACASIVAWLTVLTLGRLIGYF